MASDHEHESANTATTEKPNPEINMATFVDDFMLYPGLEFKSNGSAWQKGFLRPNTYLEERYGLPCGASIIFDLVE